MARTVLMYECPDCGQIFKTEEEANECFHSHKYEDRERQQDLERLLESVEPDTIKSIQKLVNKFLDMSAYYRLLLSEAVAATIITTTDNIIKELQNDTE